MSTTILSSRGESVVHPYPSFLSHLLSSSLLLRVLPVVPHGQDKFVQVEGGFACALDLVKHMRISSKLAEEKDRVKVKRKTVEAMLERCQRALDSLGNADSLEDDGENFDYKDAREVKDDDRIRDGSSARDQEADEFCSLLKSRLDCPDFLEKLECARVSIQEKFAEECASWDIVSENDIWEGENVDLNEEDYVLVRQEDIMDGIARFMAAYLLSLKQTKVSKLGVSFLARP